MLSEIFDSPKLFNDFAFYSDFLSESIYDDYLDLPEL